MARFASRKTLEAVLTIWVIATLVFVLARLAPGDPVEIALGDYATPESRVIVARWMGVDQPLLTQYLRYIGQLARGDLGYSYFLRCDIKVLIASQYAATLQLTLGALLISLIGIPVGVFAAVQSRRTFLDSLIMTGALIPLSAPPFFLGIVLLLVFAVRWPLFPLLGGGNASSAASVIAHLVLPSLALGLRHAAVLARFMRSAMLNVLREDYVRTARSKGLSERVTLYKHCLRNAAIPALTVLGVGMIHLIGGSVVTETVFSRPGLGQLMARSVAGRDYQLLQGVILVFAIAIVTINTLVDISYSIIDPRVKIS